MRWKALSLVLLIGVLATAGGVGAQGEDEVYTALVQVDSAFVHVAPSRDAERVASVFEDERLEVVGRNLDGTWFEVRRVGRFTSLGWLFGEMLDWDFRPEYLPLHDLTTGVEGPDVLEADPGVAIFVVEALRLRDAPSFEATQIGVVPASTTVPVLARNQNATWLYVYYLGYTGWIAAFATRGVPGQVAAVPEAPNLPPPEIADVFIVPPEVQLWHVEQVRAFTLPRRDLAAGLAGFWNAVYRGEIMPCDPPAYVTEYLYSEPDVLELPELDRYVPRLNEGVAYLNASIAPLQECGIIDIPIARRARADAINARVIFDATLDALDYLEAIIR